MMMVFTYVYIVYKIFFRPYHYDDTVNSSAINNYRMTVANKAPVTTQSVGD